MEVANLNSKKYNYNNKTNPQNPIFLKKKNLHPHHTRLAHTLSEQKKNSQNLETKMIIWKMETCKVKCVQNDNLVWG